MKAFKMYTRTRLGRIREELRKKKEDLLHSNAPVLGVYSELSDISDSIIHLDNAIECMGCNENCGVNEEINLIDEAEKVMGPIPDQIRDTLTPKPNLDEYTAVEIVFINE